MLHPKPSFISVFQNGAAAAGPIRPILQCPHHAVQPLSFPGKPHKMQDQIIKSWGVSGQSPFNTSFLIPLDILQHTTAVPRSFHRESTRTLGLLPESTHLHRTLHRDCDSHCCRQSASRVKSVRQKRIISGRGLGTTRVISSDSRLG